MTDCEEIRNAALAHAIAAYGSVSGLDDVKPAEMIISLSVLFQTYIQEGATDAYRIIGRHIEPGQVLSLVVRHEP